MEYYIVLLVFYAITLIFLRLVFAEIEGRQARKMSNVRYFLRYHSKFVYRNQFSIIFVAFLCYMIVSVEKAFSTMWFLQLLGFIAVGVISDALSQIVYYYYINFRFKKDIVESEELKNEIEQAVLNQGEELMQQTIPSYEPHRIIEDYLNEENHLAVISVDGGNFTSQFEKLPPITYSVELNPTKARETLEEKGVKVTTFTSQGKMPFKDEKLDVVVNELSNYDKFEMYRILKPGGYLVVDQLGSDNYKEIINMFIPFKLKGQWNKEACQSTLTEIGFDIVDSYEDVGHIRFHSLSAVLAFMKSISPERVKKYEQFMNFYADVLKKIKKNQFYEITTHKFMVIARKNDMKQEN